MSHRVFTHSIVGKDLSSKAESVAASSNGDRIFVGCADGTLHVYECSVDVTPRNVFDSSPDVIPRFCLVCTRKKWCEEKRAITFIEAVADWGIILSICDGYVYVHNLATLDLLDKLRNTRNCNKLCVDPRGSRMCVSIKHRLLVMKWSGKQFVEFKELHTPSTARSLVWVGSNLCVGFRREYNLLSVESGLIIKEVTDTGRKEKPLVTLIDPVTPGTSPAEFLISNDNIGYFMDYSGSPSRKESLTWSTIPMNVSCLHPYVITMLPNKVDIHNISTLFLAESISVPNCRAMHLTTFPIGQIDRTVNGTHRPRKRLSTMLVSTGTTIHSFHMVPLSMRLDQLLSSSQFSDALVLCSLAKTNDMEPAEYIRKERAIHLAFARHLFEKRDFMKCREEYLLASCDARVVLSLFAPLLPVGIDFTDFSFEVSGRNNSSTSVTSTSSSSASSSSSSSSSNEVIDRSAITNLLVPFLLHARTKTTEEEKEENKQTKTTSSSSSLSSPNSTSTASSLPIHQIRIPRANALPIGLDEIIDTVLLKAYIFTDAPLVDVIDFLTGDAQGGPRDSVVTQQQGQNNSSSDSSSSKSSAASDAAFFLPRIPRWSECRALVDESEDLLSGIAEKWEELVWFYFSKGLHQKALDWLEDAHGERQRAPFPDIEQIASKTVEYLQRLLEHVGMERLRGEVSRSGGSSMRVSMGGSSTSTSGVLSGTVRDGHERLVLEYSTWVLNYRPTLGLDVFVASDPVGAFVIHPDVVLRHIVSNVVVVAADMVVADNHSTGTAVQQQDEATKNHTSLPPTTKHELCVAYLEYMLLLLPKIRKHHAVEEFSRGGQNNRRGRRPSQRAATRIDIRPTRTLRARTQRTTKDQRILLDVQLQHIHGDADLHNALALYYLRCIDDSSSFSSLSSSSTVSRAPTTKTIARETGRRADMRRRLVRFLQESDRYQSHAILTKFQATSLYEERAVLLRRAGRHEEALRIYVHDMGELDMAKSYCDEVFREGSSVGGGSGSNGSNSSGKSTGSTNGSRVETGDGSSNQSSFTVPTAYEERDVYLMLLRTCLQQPASVQRLPGWAGGRNTALIEPALKILNEHSGDIDPVQALSLLPPSTSVADLHSYLEGVLRDTTTRRRNTQVCKNLLKLELLQAMRVGLVIYILYFILLLSWISSECFLTYFTIVVFIIVVFIIVVFVIVIVIGVVSAFALLHFFPSFLSAFIRSMLFFKANML